MISFIIFLVILGILVLIHEFGHFIAAKKSGIRVEEFGFGFPPRIIGKKKGDTLYSINAIPLGGFVRLYGEEYEELQQNDLQKINSSNKKKAFVFKHPLIKTVVILAGVFMNLILGVTIYYFLIGFQGFKSDPIPLIVPYQFKFGLQEGRVVAASIIKGSPAEKSGISSEDLILRYKLPQSDTWVDIQSAKELINKIKTNAGTEIMLEVENYRNGNKKVINVVPYFNKTLKRAVIGINLIDMAVISYKRPTDMVFSGFLHSYNIMAYNLSTIKQLFSFAVKEKNFEPVTQTVSGPIGIFSVINEIVHSSGSKLLINLLNVIALLSLSLAVMNVLPFPALDGGRMVFILYEWISGKQTHKTIEKYVNLGGFIFLIAVAVLVSINDIIRLFKR